jgi:hypothetical protein
MKTSNSSPETPSLNELKELRGYVSNQDLLVRQPQSSWSWKNKRLLRRLAVGYVFVPLSAPTMMVLLSIVNTRGMSFGDWAGIVLLYTIFGFAAMVVLGTPLLLLYSRLNWTGFFAFVAGGAVCAVVTDLLVMRGEITDQLPFFAMFGVVEGFAFRLILSGVRLRPRLDAI